jgi:hypothetical protein
MENPTKSEVEASLMETLPPEEHNNDAGTPCLHKNRLRGRPANCTNCKVRSIVQTMVDHLKTI